MVVSAPAEVKAADKKLVFWDKSEYVAAYNDMMKAKLDEFAEANGVDVEYVIVPSGDIKQKLAAAIESGNQPDLIMGDNTLVAEYINSDQLAEVEMFWKYLTSKKMHLDMQPLTTRITLFHFPLQHQVCTSEKINGKKKAWICRLHGKS